VQNLWSYLAIFSLLGIVVVHFSFSPLSLLCILFLLVYLFTKNRRLGISSLIVLVVFAGLYFYHDSHNKSNLSISNTTFKGKILTRPVINGDQLRFIFQTVKGEKLYFTFKINEEEQKESLLRLSNRTICRFQGKLRPPQASRNFYQFDFKRYLYWNHIHWMVSPTSFSLSNCENEQVTTLDMVHRGRDHSLKFIENYFPTPLNGFVQALLFGDRALLEEDTLNSYQDLGLIHLLAISGMHVSLICSFFYFLAVRAGVTKEKVIFFMMILLPFYVLIAGSTPSVIRAAIMTFLVLLKIRFRSFPLTSLDLISIAFMVMVVFNPYYVFQAGFQLSFTVTLALILSSQTILQRYSHPIIQLTVASSISQISSLPLVLYHFYQFSLLSIPLNLIYIPVLTFIILPLCFLLFFIQFLTPTLNTFLLPLTNHLLKIINMLAINVAENNWQLLVLGRPSSFMLFLYILVSLCTFILWERRQKGIVVICMPILTLLCFHWVAPYISSEGEVTIIDVGQGDSILIELPYRKEVYLIDSGGTVSYAKEKWEQKRSPYSISNDVIIPYLKAKGIRKIDKLILTHSDVDHIGEAENIINKIKISKVLIGDFHDASDLENQVLNAAKEKKVAVEIVKAGDEWHASGTNFRVLAPSGYYENKNEGSIVLSTFLGGKSWLFTGDIENEGELDLVSNYPELKVDVLKVAHHGSNSSTTDIFLKTVHPEIALISAGVKNRYGHPNQEVLERLRQERINVLRTDQNGAIRFIFSTRNTGTFQVKFPYDIVKDHQP
jgi:competence protein ComEC